jgi:hypothetical protein
MNVVSVFSEVAVVVSLLLAISAAAIVGPERIRSELPALRTRLRQAARPLLLLVAVLAVNSVVRDFGVGLSWLIGSNITKTIYAIEGSLVATIQALSPAWLTLYLGFVYVYGYVFLLVFPLLLALLLTETRYLDDDVLDGIVNEGKTFDGESGGFRRLVDMTPPDRYGVMIGSTFVHAGRERIEISELHFDTELFVERCEAKGMAWRFENRFWIGRDDGDLWIDPLDLAGRRTLDDLVVVARREIQRWPRVEATGRREAGVVAEAPDHGNR